MESGRHPVSLKPPTAVLQVGLPVARLALPELKCVTNSQMSACQTIPLGLQSIDRDHSRLYPGFVWEMIDVYEGDSLLHSQ
jgi:hypothetical protein